MSSGKAIVRALRYLRRYLPSTVGAIIALVLVSAANLTAPQFVRRAVDGGLAQKSWPTVGSAVLGLIALAVARGLFNFAQGYLAERASQGVAFDLREGLFATSSA